MLHLFSDHRSYLFNKSRIPGLRQHGSYRNGSTVLIISLARKFCRTIVEKSAFQTEFKWHGNDFALIYIVVFHKTKASRAICKNNTCKAFVYGTSVCLSRRTWYRNSCGSKISALCFSRITSSQIDQLVHRQGIYKFHCRLICQLAVLTVYNFLCLKISSFHFQNRKLFFPGKSLLRCFTFCGSTCCLL